MPWWQGALGRGWRRRPGTWVEVAPSDSEEQRSLALEQLSQYLVRGPRLRPPAHCLAGCLNRRIAQPRDSPSRGPSHCDPQGGGLLRQCRAE